MAVRDVPVAKVTRPVSPGVYPRRRLFGLLDEFRKKPVVWVCGPPGCGKTTLLSSYVEARRLRHIWYQVDEADRDVATFFHYLGLAVRRAAPRVRRPLPVLTPEYLPGLAVFTRRFFEETLGRLKSPAVLVFDNCQKVPADTPFQQMLRDVLSGLPSGITAVLVSRETPSPGYARLRANRLLETIGWKELRLTAEEAEGVVRSSTRGQRKPTAETVRMLQRRADGWAAGLVLMLDHGDPAAIGSLNRAPRTPSEIVDYFGGEIFDATDEEARRFLLRSAFLPRSTVSMAERLTGYAGAGRVLSYLHRSNFFTEAHPGDEPIYEYHALFREFLLARAKTAIPAEEIAALQRAAAGLLIENGHAEDAVALLRDCGEWAALCRLILAQAPALVAQGRFRTLEEWLRFLPQSMLDEVPWLRYWMGVSGGPLHPGESRAHFEQAYRKFREQEDVPGIFLAWSGVVESIVYGFKEFKSLGSWLAEIDDVLEEFREFPSREIEERIACSMMKAIGFFPGGPVRAGEDHWVERALSVARTSPNGLMKFDSLVSLFHYFQGRDFMKAEMILDMMREVRSHPAVPPIARLATFSFDSAHAIGAGAYDRCLNAVRDGLELAAATGIHRWDFILIGQSVLQNLIAGDRLAAKDSLRKMADSLGMAKPHEAGFYHYVAAWDALGERDLANAQRHSEHAADLCEETGFCWTLHLTHVQRAFVAFESGSDDQAAEHLRAARRLIPGEKCDYPEFVCPLAEAYFLLRRGKDDAALAPLRQGLRAGREKGLCGVYLWRPGFLETVTAKAIEAGIEADYARELIRKNRLVPGEAQLGLEQWPWPVKVRTLGGFEIVRDDRPLAFSRKVQQKPLAMLKVLIALGGRDVPEERITDILWPEGEGDLAHQSFTTTLRRLRALLGDERILPLRDGRLSLDERYCWTDVRALDRLIAESDREKDSPSHDAARHKKTVSRILALYRGPFLAGEDGAHALLTCRERLRSRFLRCVADCGRHLEDAGEWEAALSCYRKGLEVDELAEEFCRGLIGCYGRLGRKAEAVSLYRSCRKALSTQLGVEPSRETEALFRSLVPPEE